MKTDRPNILFIITDHHAYFDHYGTGPGRLDPPVWRQFCSEGVRFGRAYSVCPICTPARSSMMTGQYPSKHGLRWNTEATGNPDNLIDFLPGQKLYSHYLEGAGYQNAYVGKWHCGHEKIAVDYGIEGWSLPDYGKVYMSQAYREYAEARGFGDARATIEHDCVHPEREGKTFTLHHESTWHFMDASGVFEGPPEAHEQQFTAYMAIEKLKELAEGEQPFSLVASFWGPHQPFYPSEPYASMIDPESIPEYPSFRDDYANKPWRHLFHRDLKGNAPKPGRWSDWSVWQEILARAYGQSLQLDAAIGQLLGALDETGLAENTMVIWVADHGDAVASHAGLWDKASTFTEEVGRVPMAIRWPGRLEPVDVDRPVSNMDVTATMLDAAGVSVPDDMHSRSVLPLCDDPEDRSYPDHVICEHHGHGDNIVQRIIVRGRWKYVAAHLDMDELYDLEADPHELTNLVDAPEHSDVRAELRQKLIDHIERTGDRWASIRLLYELKRTLNE